jgi:sugar phosphate permease
LSAWLTARVGWRLSLQLLGGLIILIALPLAYLVKEGRDGSVAVRRGSTEPAVRRNVSIADIVRTPTFYLLALGSMCSIAAVGGTNQHLKLFLSLDRGYSQAEAAGIISLVLTISIVGRLLMGWLADRVPRKLVMVLIYMLVATAIPLLLVRTAAPGAATMYLFAGVFGLGLGGEYLIIPLMAGELFGIGVLGRVMGIVLTADGVAEATAPVLVGYLRDRTGTYNAGFFLLIGIALVGATAIAFLPAAQKLESKSLITL